MRLIAVVLGSASIKGREEASAALLNYGFTFFETINVEQRGTTVLKPRVYKARRASTMSVGPAADINIVVPRGQAGSIETSASVQPPLIAPLTTSAPVGAAADRRRRQAGRVGAAVPAGGRAEGRLWSRLSDAVRLWFSAARAALRAMAEPLPICHLNGSAAAAARGAHLAAGSQLPVRRRRLRGHPRLRGGSARRLRCESRAPARAASRELRIRNPHSDEQWAQLVEELIAANGGGDVYVYLQVSRGAEYGRNHAPLPELDADGVRLLRAAAAAERRGARAAASPASPRADTRWARCDIKSVALLANVLLRQQAVEAGAERDHSAARRLAHRGQRLERLRGHRRADLRAAELDAAAAGHHPRPDRGAGRRARHRAPQSRR